jgi:hypothetical protein
VKRIEKNPRCSRVIKSDAANYGRIKTASTNSRLIKEWRTAAMETHRDNHETSPSHANYSRAATAADGAHKRRCRSESEAATSSREIDWRTGAKVGRSQSTDMANYEPLSRVNFLVNREELHDDDDYELLSSSSDDGIELTELHNDDGQRRDNGCRCSIIDHTRQLNVIAAPPDDCAAAAATAVIRRFSTLPRSKSRDDGDARRSCKVKRLLLDSPKSMVDIKKKVKTHKGDQIGNSTTLPKARSRASESRQFRHSLRHPIDSDRARKSASTEENNGTATAATAGESTSGTGE